MSTLNNSNSSNHTPGVYLSELEKVPHRIVERPTYVAAFVGYTQKSEYGGTSHLNRPLRVSSLGQFVEFFGGPPEYVVGSLMDSYMLYYSVDQFFYNGGFECYVVAVGGYADAIDKGRLSMGLESLVGGPEVSILVVPEAVLLPAEDCFAIQREMLALCGCKLNGCFAVLDIHSGYKERGGSDDPIVSFRRGIGDICLGFGAAYYPWVKRVDTGSLMPVSGIVAGIYCKVDTTVGVWKAPANVPFVHIAGLAFKTDMAFINALNASPGVKPVNGILYSQSEGIRIWGSRTLESSRNEFSFVNVVRTRLMIEDSLKVYLSPFAYENNGPETWAKIKSVVDDFLGELRKKGALQGSANSDAFGVEVGLGETMCENDLHEGNLHIHVNIALSRPGNFHPIHFTFKKREIPT